MKNVSGLFLLSFTLLLLIAPQSFAIESTREVIASAQIRSTVAPSYPYLMRHAEAAAEVTVAFTVDSRGMVTKAKIVNSSNYEFNAATLAAIKQWSFTPALKNGQPVETKLQQKFVFSVRDQAESNAHALVVAKKRSP
jgi:TonB family protein